MPTLKGFTFKNQTETSADLYFYGDIVSDWWGAWQDEDQYPDAIKNFLSEQEGKDLNVYVNSGGGSVFAGIAIYNMIKRHAAKANVKVYVDGLAGSIASILAFAGSEPPEIPSNAFLMIHNPWSYCEGNAADMRKMADDQNRNFEHIRRTPERRCNNRPDRSVNGRRKLVKWRKSRGIFRGKDHGSEGIRGSSRGLHEESPLQGPGKIKNCKERTRSGAAGGRRSGREKKTGDPRSYCQSNYGRRIKHEV